MQALAGTTAAQSQLTRAREIGRTTGSRYLLALADVQESALLLTIGDYRSAREILGNLEVDDLASPRERYSAHLNRGVAHLNLVELESSRSELEAALHLALDMAEPLLEAKARHDLGVVTHVSGDIPGAIRLMRAAEALPVEIDRVETGRDLALAYLDAGLVDAALVQLDDALAAARRVRHRLAEGELLLTRARARLLVGDRAAARRDALGAARAFTDRDDVARSLQARLIAIAASGRPRRSTTVTEAEIDAAARIDPYVAKFALRMVARAQVRGGDVEAARATLGKVPRRRAEGIGDTLLDTLVRTEIHLAEGRKGAGRRLLGQAARRLAAHQGRAQSLEIRAAVAVHGRALADVDVGLALETGRAGGVFDAVERWRAASSRGTFASPEDPATRELLAQLRVARHAATDTTASREVVHAARLHAAELSKKVSAQLWTAADESGAALTAAADHDEVRRRLAERGQVLVLFFAHRGSCHRLVVGRGRTSLARLGRLDDIGRLARQLSDDLAGLAQVAHVPALRAAVRRAVDSSARELDRVLLTGVTPGPGGIAVAPTGLLSTTPWGLLPTLRGAPVGVCVSITRWARTPAPHPSHRVAALAGPDVERGAEEARSVASRWAGHGRATDARALARTADLREALEGADLVHVAAHGTHEDQNPLFSAIHLHDGPVVVHELPRPPRASHLVLSACDLGRSRIRVGDEPLGLTAGLLTIGVDTVVSSVVPVRDTVAAEAMVAYHEALAGGAPATVALASAVGEVPEAVGFCVFGSDWQVA